MYGSPNRPATDKQREIIADWAEKQSDFIQQQPPISLTKYADGIPFGQELERMAGTELEAYLGVLKGIAYLPMSSATASDVIEVLTKPLNDSFNAMQLLKLVIGIAKAGSTIA